MKKIYVIVFVFAGLTLASCSKEQVSPVTQGVNDVPVWQKTFSDDEDDEDDSKPASEEQGREITDPNNDPDGNKK